MNQRRNMLLEGDKCPDICLKDENDQEIDLKILNCNGYVLFFYPKDDTSGCTKEAIAFTEAIEFFEKKNISVFGISKDSVTSHKKFIKKYNLKTSLLSDESCDVLKKFNVWKEKKMYGKTYMGVERSTFIINEKFEIIKIYRKVKVQGHVEKIQAYLS